MKAALWYAAACLATVVLVGWLVSVLYPGVAARSAIVTSAVIACVVQGVGFTIARRMRHTNVLGGWAIGAALCMSSLIAYGMVVRALGVPLEPALVSLAGFYFVTETVEPLLLNS
jgi:hypothetical protein